MLRYAHPFYLLVELMLLLHNAVTTAADKGADLRHCNMRKIANRIICE